MRLNVQPSDGCHKAWGFEQQGDYRCAAGAGVWTVHIQVELTGLREPIWELLELLWC